ncbi:hypothetical protein GCM10027160_24190 [Streptomyces calidiresistens]
MVVDGGQGEGGEDDGEREGGHGASGGDVRRRAPDHIRVGKAPFFHKWGDLTGC